MVKVTFLDYGAGNILSLRNALEKVGCEIQVPAPMPTSIRSSLPQAQQASAPSHDATQPSTGEDFALSVHFPHDDFFALPCSRCPPLLHTSFSPAEKRQHDYPCMDHH